MVFLSLAKSDVSAECSNNDLILAYKNLIGNRSGSINSDIFKTSTNVNETPK